MNTLLITYELKAARDYSGLYDTIKAANGWWHYLDSTWLIKTNETPSEWASKLRPHIDEIMDSILVIDIPPNAKRGGWLSRKAWDWIDSNV